MENHLLIMLILSISFLTVAFLTWFFIHRARAKERLALIEKGIDPSQLANISRISWLKIGIVTVAASTGLIIGFILESLLQSGHGLENHSALQSWQFPLPILLMFLFGGIGMIVGHIIEKPKGQP
jgi:hypothetical protein